MMKSTKRVATLTLASAALLGLLGTGYAGAATYDTVYYGGKIYTMSEDTQNGKNMKALDPSQAITVEAVGVKGGKIVYAGPQSGINLDDATNKVDLKGKTMLPGFVDGHGHFPGQGTKDLYQLDLGSPPLGTMTSIADYQAALKPLCEADTNDEGILAVGYDDTLIEDMRHPTSADIEAVCPGKKVYLSHISGHVGVASYRLFQEAGLISDTQGTPTDKLTNDPKLSGVERKNGKVTGVLFEMDAMGSVTKPSPKQDAQLGLARASEVFLSKGVTLADTGGAMIGGTSGSDVTYQVGLSKGNLGVRVAVHPFLMPTYGMYSTLSNLGWTNLPKAPTSAADQPTAADYLASNANPGNAPAVGADITSKKFGNTTHEIAANLPPDRLFLAAYKIIGDGSPQAYTAWMKDPGNYDWADYTPANSHVNNPDSPTAGTKYDSPNYFNGLDGTINVWPEDLKALIELAHKNNVSTETHTNGSAYAEMWLEALELAVSKYPDITDTRHTSIHAQTFERDVVERLAGSYDTVNPKMSNQMFGAFGNSVDGTPGDYDASQVNGVTKERLAELMRAQNFFASFFMTHTYYYGERHRDTFFGPGRAYNISPAGWATAFGLNYSLHNDNTVTPIEPLQSVESAITRLSAKSLVSPGGEPIYYTGTQAKDNVDATDTFNQRKIDGVESEPRDFYVYDQRINVLQALHAVTINPAFQNKISDRIGSIEEGKYADFVILDDDPIAVAESDPTLISDIRVAATIVSDEVKYGILPNATTFASDVKAGYLPGYNIPTAVKTVVKEGTEADQVYAPGKNEIRLACFQLNATAEPGQTVLFQMAMLGNGKPVSEIHLYDATDTSKAEEFTYGLNSRATTGNFWIADQKSPKVMKETTEVLANDGAYVVYFTMTADQSGNISAPIVLVSGSQDGSEDGKPDNNSPVLKKAATSGDSNGGCTVGTKPSYDLTILLGMLAGLVGLRGLRRRFFGGSNS